ncbi:MAG: hypothetical protein NZ533_00060 [Casimicrobiaceae bacterium]|nr:hypothetical protein [Casimicrobiaceae bacterium]MCX8098726.1 hypothetical protein [Casimicrobiaceae bacterium]MDW8312165.1 hypothetical protein [Burkholderiales bacterium]
METLLAIAHNLVMLVGIFYIAQFVVGIFNWPARERNPIYRLFRFLASPFTTLVRRITPAAIEDRFIPFVAFSLCFWLYVVLFFARLCLKFPHVPLCAGG